MDSDVSMQVRWESDSIGTVAIPADRLWGAQTQRALRHFTSGLDKIPDEVIMALAMIKKSAALANVELGVLPEDKGNQIAAAADEIITGSLHEHFPLSIWMSGSGTQANMNINEVIANRCIQLAGGVIGSKDPIHPNDHVNLSQSTNDIFPTAMHIAAARGIKEKLLPSIRGLCASIEEKTRQWATIIKVGRTHLQDAVPLTLGQEFLGYVGMLEDNLAALEGLLPRLYNVAIGGTAVGTGLGAPVGFDDAVCRYLVSMTGLPLRPAKNKFAIMGAHNALVATSAALKELACSLYKIANDIRLLGSGPRCGIHELQLPSNEPGSSMMPGKSNPTQCEVITMIAVQVMGFDTAVTFAGAGGQLEMNAYKPLIIHNIMHSIFLLTDGCFHFDEYLMRGLEPDRKVIEDNCARSLMLATVLLPIIGYDKVADIVRLAEQRGITLKAAAVELGYISAEMFDRYVNPCRMIQPSSES